MIVHRMWRERRLAGHVIVALLLAWTAATLVAWLEREYKLTPNAAAVVAGSAMRDDIAEVADPLVQWSPRCPRPRSRN